MSELILEIDTQNGTQVFRALSQGAHMECNFPGTTLQDQINSARAFVNTLRGGQGDTINWFTNNLNDPFNEGDMWEDALYDYLMAPNNAIEAAGETAFTVAGGILDGDVTNAAAFNLAQCMEEDTGAEALAEAVIETMMVL